jgi:hypothetical protein
MSRTLVALSLAALAAPARAAACGSASGGPTDDPVAALYGNSSYPWAHALRWTCVYNVRDFAGSADDAFAAAQVAAVAGGGGVVYFPPATYVFARNLSLASNVVIRGAPAAGAAKSGKLPGPLAPTTVFQCPNRAHQGVWNFDAAATNIGVVNVLLDQCAVMFWPGLETRSFAPMMSSWWFSATDVRGMGSNKLVLGNVIRDVSLGQSLLGPKYKNVYPYIFGIALGVYTDKNALVANNLLPASRRNETTSITVDSDKGPVHMTVPYAYDNRYGIDVNTILLGAVASSYCKGPGSKCGTPSAFGGLSPPCAPWNFRTGIVIRDNWVAQNGRVGISFTGGDDAAATCAQGSGTVVLNNHVEVRAGTTCYAINGDSEPKGSDTNENRGFMLSGYCSNVTGNSAHVNRQLAGSSGYETVDGEGLLHQAENGNAGYGDLIVGNDFRGGSSGYVGNWDLESTKHTHWEGNMVNLDQFIGAICLNDDQAGAALGNTCKDNSPQATLCACTGGKCVKTPC